MTCESACIEVCLKDNAEKYKYCSKDTMRRKDAVAELIATVTKTYNDYDYDAVTLWHVWARLFAKYSEILPHKA